MKVPASDPLEDYRSVWDRKPVLRMISRPIR
jgi:hypothetical protein